MQAPAIAANALYMDRYPLVSAISRPLIVKHLVAAAHKYGADAVEAIHQRSNPYFRLPEALKTPPAKVA